MEKVILDAGIMEAFRADYKLAASFNDRDGMSEAIWHKNNYIRKCYGRPELGDYPYGKGER